MRGRRVISPAHPMSQRHSNSLKPHRKRSGFTQGELAYLLGLKEHSAISRFEQGHREPSLRTAFAYRLLFDRGLEQLFPQVHAEVCAELASRTEQLSKQIARGGHNPKCSYKLQKLAALQRVLSAPAQAV